LVSLICLALAAPEPPELPVRPGAEIQFDGKVEETEWRDAFSIQREHPDGGRVRFFLKRNGPWLALALSGEGAAYRGEILRFYTADPSGAWFTSLLFGIGHPALPPLLWRRGAAEALIDPERGPSPECPRAARLRLDVEGKERWSAEYLVRLSALGVGCGDLRDWRARIALVRPEPEEKTIFILPEGAKRGLEVAHYARLVSPDEWGAGERWAPVSTEVSREFDDHELLHRLFLEHDRISLREEAEELVIHNAVRPRSMMRIGSLKRQLEGGRGRNPTLPAWTYFLGRLLNEGNMYAEARQVIESVPEALRGLDPFAGLAADHYNDTMEFEKALEVCKAYPRARNALENAKNGLAGRRAWAAEQEALKKDTEKKERNPKIKLVTEKGDIVCELFEDDAPHAVRNLMDLILRQKYYDKLRFHRVSGGMVAQIGDPRTRPGAVGEADGPAWRIRVDDSPRPFMRGYLATVPTEDGVFHGSQFAMALSAFVRESRYAAVFGRVVEGLDVLESLEQDDRLERIEVLFRRNHSYDCFDSRYRR
jgi:peptidyl-prolyl cis-trans isomerase B (cyclophilin B)